MNDSIRFESVSFFCPAYNDEKNVTNVITRADQLLRGSTDTYEIIVVEDGSPDNTFGVLTELAKDYPALRIIHHETNLGYGAALKDGFEASRYNLVMYTDGDFQYDPLDFSRLLAYVHDYDVVIGYKIKRNDSRYREVQSYLFNALVRILFGTDFRDINCSMKIFRKSFLDKIRIECHSAFIDVELILKAKALGATMKEVPVSHYPRAHGKPGGVKLRVILPTIRDICPVLSKKSLAPRSANTESITGELEAKMNTDPTHARVLITGCGGMLGEAVQLVFTQCCPGVLATDIDINETWLTHSDVRDIAECKLRFARFQPTLVIHLAALTDLEYCETHPEDAWRTNALGTENVALLCRDIGCTMVYISTAGVFDGRAEYFNDFDEPHPLSVYGKSKYYGECIVQRLVPAHYVFRAGWMMGGGVAKDKKFINKIYRQIAQGATELFIVDDKLGTPTYTHNFAHSMYKVIQSGYFGLYNMVCGGSCSRLDVAREFVRLLGLADTIRVTPVTSDYFQRKYFAPRPRSEKLVNLKLTARGINYMRDWKECLSEYSEVFRNDYRLRQVK